MSKPAKKVVKRAFSATLILIAVLGAAFLHNFDYEWGVIDCPLFEYLYYTDEYLYVLFASLGVLGMALSVIGTVAKKSAERKSASTATSSSESESVVAPVLNAVTTLAKKPGSAANDA